MREDIRHIAERLDDTIQKSREISNERVEKSRHRHKERSELRKAISFNPLKPTDMTTNESQDRFYCPYRRADDGGFYPHTPEYWLSQIRSGDQSFRNTPGYRDGYRHLFDYFKSESALNAAIEKSLGEILLKATFPIGTVHQYKGVPFKKVGEGKWVPVTDGKGPHPVEEDVKKKRAAIKNEIDSRKKGEKEEPNFEKRRQVAQDRARKFSEHEKVLSEKEKELQDRDHESRTKDLDLREAELEKREKEVESKESPAKFFKQLEDKVRRKGPGEGQHIDLTKDELEALLHSGKYALVSAGKNPNHPLDRKLPDEEIKKRYNQMEADLKNDGFMYTKVKGKYGEEEDSFLVMIHDADKKHVKILGKAFNQDSVIYANRGRQEMIFTTGKNEGKAHKGEGFEEKEGAKDFFTEIEHPDGSKTKFALNFDFDQLHEPKGKVPYEQQKLIEQTKNFKSTREHHSDLEGGYLPHRQKLHEKIFEEKLKDVKPAKGQLVAVLTGGGSGSGKSAVLRSALERLTRERGRQELVHIDADDLKESLPEYQAMIDNEDPQAAAHSHDESSDLASELIRRSMESNRSFVYDSTMKSEKKMRNLIEKLKAAGYHIQIAYADVHKETAWQRNLSRAKETGRLVKKDIFDSAHDGAPKTLGAIADMADAVHVFSTEGHPPKTVYSRVGDKRDIDKEHHEEMLKRGHTIKSMTSAGEGAENHELAQAFIDQIMKHDEEYEVEKHPETPDHGVDVDQYQRSDVDDGPFVGFD